jgi:hypothetical protein
MWLMMARFARRSMKTGNGKKTTATMLAMWCKATTGQYRGNHGSNSDYYTLEANHDTSLRLQARPAPPVGVAVSPAT